MTWDVRWLTCLVLTAVSVPGALLGASLDPSFGVGGRASTPTFQPAGMAVMPDGRVVVTGGGFPTITTRLQADGSLDSTFNGTGSVSIYVGPFLLYSPATALALQPDGKAIIGGSELAVWGDPKGRGAHSGPFLFRLNLDGTRDGFATQPALAMYQAYGDGAVIGIVMQPDGKLVAISQQAIRRHSPEGPLDPSFAGGFFPGTGGVGLARQADGKLVVFGTRGGAGGSEFGFLRYSAEGVLETSSFQGMGDLFFAAAGAIQPDGKLVIVGGSEYESVVLRFTAAGALDASFGAAGSVREPGATWRDVLVQPDGRIVLLASDEVRRLMPDGTRDAGFGVDGRFGVYTGDGLVRLGRQASGKILAVGARHVTSGERGMVVRIDPDAVPELVVDPPVLDLGVVPMNLPISAILSIANTGPSQVAIAQMTATSWSPHGTPALSVSHNCPSIIPAGGRCDARVEFTSPSFGFGNRNAVRGVVTVDTSKGPVQVPFAATGELSLVTHYYRSILRRMPDYGGYSYWSFASSLLRSLGVGDAEAWYGMATTFFTGPEYASFLRSDTEYLRDLYRAFFNREGDESGMSYWSAQLTGGMPRDAVLGNFMLSPEFDLFVTRIFGSVHVPPHKQTVLDFYRGFLGRLPDTAGFNFWVEEFRRALCTRPNVVETAEAISASFANGPEYTARNRTDAQFVGDLYNAFLRRGGDLEGILFWRNQIASGARTREQVRVQFRDSPEFRARLAAIAAAGCPQ